MKTYCIVDKDTRKIIACIPEDGKSVVHNDYELEIFYDNVEPIFLEGEKEIILKQNSCIIKL